MASSQAHLPIDAASLAIFCRRNDIRRLRVFGSAARGEDQPSSDIDLLADFSAPKSPLTLVALERQLSASFGRKVDLLTEESISPYLRQSILRDARTVYAEG